MSNKINELSPKFRDNLLRYNLAFAESVEDYKTYANGIGRMVDPFSLPLDVIDRPSVLDIGKKELKQIFNNKYQAYDYPLQGIIVKNYSNQTIEGGYYLHGEINGYGQTTFGKVANMINGGNFLPDVSITTLAEFVGVSLGLIKDTQLGKDSASTLWKHLGYRTAQNTYKNTLGKINLNITSLLNGDDFLKGDFQITKSKNNLSDLLDPAIKVIGVENPFVELSNSSSIYSFENKGIKIGNKATNLVSDSLISETGRGQANLLKSNLEANIDEKYGRVGYIPNLNIYGKEIGSEDSTYLNVIDEDNVEEFDTYKTLQQTNNLETSYDINKGLNSLNVVDDDSEQISKFRHSRPNPVSYQSNRKSILDKTQELFNSDKIKTILYNKGIEIDNTSELVNIHANGSRNFNGTAISKGAQYVYLDSLLSETSESDPNKYFCRSWVNGYSYDKVNRLQKHRGLDGQIGLRRSIDSSVLDTNGFVRYSPYKDEQKSSVKKYMFSLENLAWANDLANLPEWEIGNGDPLTGTTGRIMWFPPYDLTISESTVNNIDTHNFIGRSEPVYTFNSSERVGQLSFKVLVDHPQYMNDTSLEEYFGDSYDDALQSLIVGCGDFTGMGNNSLTEAEKVGNEVMEAQVEQIKNIAEEKPPEGFNIYFPNDVASLSGTTNLDEIDTWHLIDWDNTPINDVRGKYAWGIYEIYGSQSSPLETRWRYTKNEKYTAGRHTNQDLPYDDQFNYGLNSSWRNKKFLSELRENLKKNCPSCKVLISGYASKDGKVTSNDKLSSDRAKNVSDFLKATVFYDDLIDEDTRFGENDISTVGKGETGIGDNSRQDTLGKKKARMVTVTFKPDLKVQVEMAKKAGEEVGNAKSEFGKELKKKFFNEAMFFKRLAETDSLYYEKISEKLKYFSPAFHTITPEGLNSRLTFLQQCLKQGGTNTDSMNRPNNMAFGMPPVCILRIGDFYNCKVIIDSLNIEYEQTWDINPEGIGVQPMIANVSLSFKMLGGSSMIGPINKLQNALSFNYYANTEIYDPRSDYFTKFTDKDSNKVEITKDDRVVSRLDRQRGEYTNGIDDMYLLLNNVYENRAKIEVGDVENIDTNIEPLKD